MRAFTHLEEYESTIDLPLLLVKEWVWQMVKDEDVYEWVVEDCVPVEEIDIERLFFGGEVDEYEGAVRVFNTTQMAWPESGQVEVEVLGLYDPDTDERHIHLCAANYERLGRKHMDERFDLSKLDL